MLMLIVLETKIEKEFLAHIFVNVILSWKIRFCILCFYFLCNNFFNTGLGDPSGRDSLHIAEMVKELKQLEYINAFLILFNAQNPRLDESLRAMIDIFTQIFGRERFFDNVVLVFTRWEHSEKAERKRQRSGFY